jgi:uncharacterized protein YbjT (DUF2867 family)
MTRSWMKALQCIGEALDIHNLDREPGKIFITGGHGVIERRIVTKLVHVGYADVRVGTDIKNSLDQMSVNGAEYIDFSWNREETYANALIGIKSVIITMPYQKHWYKHFSAFLKACKKAGVKHYVKLSFYLSNIAGTRQIPFVKHHTNCDEMLMNLILPDEEHLSQMSYTILSASHFMSNPTINYGMDLNSTQPFVNCYGASKGHGCNYISPNDVSDAALCVVLSPREHYNRIYTLLGPELITVQDISDLMSKYYGKNIDSVDISLSMYRNILLERNIPRWKVKDLVAMQQVLASGLENNIVRYMQNDFETICGYHPESFTEYLTRTETMTFLESGITKCFP